jgi:hypothetical protein
MVDNAILLRIATALEEIAHVLKVNGGVNALGNCLALMATQPEKLTGEQKHFLVNTVRASIDSHVGKEAE